MKEPWKMVAEKCVCVCMYESDHLLCILSAGGFIAVLLYGGNSDITPNV